MSVQKLIAEADKLFEKGKHAEGVAKIKQALSEEPLNQLVATKLANIYVQDRKPEEASKVYGALAKRLSDAGKSQVAIAIYKQAVELSPDDIGLRVRYAQECESVGKLGDAFLQGQIALQFYLRRKKYFDAANLMPLLARSQPKDDKIKLAWVEILNLSQADQKLVHFLVAAWGPPGVVSPEFPVGGEPTAMSPALYDGLKKLVPFFPRDPRVAYTAAWAAYRRGRMKEFYGYLRECLRREPDFSLALLLFARVLAEGQRLNESLFIYKYFKQRMGTDKNADMLTLNRLMDTFVEKNGWIKFIEDSGEVLDAAGFMKSMTGDEAKAAEAAKASEERGDEDSKKVEEPAAADLPPAEIELGGGTDLPADPGMDIVLATGQTLTEASKVQKAAKEERDPLKLQAELIKAAIEATVAGMGGQNQATQQTVVQPVMVPVVQAAPQLSPEMVAQAQAAVAASLGQVPLAPAAPAPAAPAAPPPAKQATVSTPPPPAEPTQPTQPSGPSTPAPEDPTGEINFQGESVEFTSLIKLGADEKAALAAPPSPEVPVAAPGDSTGLLPKPDAVDDGATRVAPMPAEPAEEADPGEEIPAEAEAEEEAKPGKVTFNPMEHASVPDEKSAPAAKEEREERTQMFSPMDVIDAGKVMKNRDLSDVETRSIQVDRKQLDNQKREIELEGAEAEVASQLTMEETAEADKTKWRNLKVDGERTGIYSPVEAVQAATDSRRPVDAQPLPAKGEWIKEKPKAPPAEAAPEKAADTSATPAVPGPAESGDATMVIKRPEQGTKGSDFHELANEGEATRFVSRPALEEPEKSGAIAAAPSPGAPLERTQEVPLEGDEAPLGPAAASEPTPSAKDAKAPAIMPIPEEVPAPADLAEQADGEVDLGDDLLEGATKIFSAPITEDKTEHLIKEIRKEMKEKANAFLNIDMLIKKADRYTAKRNYYLARKSLRHALALGADEETVKARLREIRKLELPDGLYNTISSDRPEKVDTAEVLERLEQEFDLAQPTDDDGAGPLGALVEGRIEAIFQEADPRTILDFGVGLHEMGLYRQAETLLMRLVREFPDFSFDAYYLAAMAKLSRRDYAGAASILKRLSSDAGKTEQEKIQIYYALGETYEKMRQRDRSRKFFEKVAELDANYRNIRHKLEE